MPKRDRVIEETTIEIVKRCRESRLSQSRLIYRITSSMQGGPNTHKKRFAAQEMRS